MPSPAPGASISLAVQELTLPRIAQALVERHRAGVQVRVVLENSYSTPWSRQHPSELDDRERHRWQRLHDLADADGDGTVTQAERRAGDAVALLLADGVPLLDDTADGSAGSGLMHHKFLVVDGREVVTGSANFTSSGIHGDAGAPHTRGNVNHVVRIQSTALASLFEEEFARLWGDGPRWIGRWPLRPGQGQRPQRSPPAGREPAGGAVHPPFPAGRQQRPRLH